MGKRREKNRICVSAAVLLLTVCCMACGGKKNASDALEGSLSNIMEELYARADLDEDFRESLADYETVEITDEMESYILGTDEITYTEGVASVPLISPMAYQCVLLRVDEADVETAKQLLQENANLDKWVCVSAETMLIESRGNVIFFIMAEKDKAYAMNAAFQNL